MGASFSYYPGSEHFWKGQAKFGPFAQDSNVGKFQTPLRQMPAPKAKNRVFLEKFDPFRQF